MKSALLRRRHGKGRGVRQPKATPQQEESSFEQADEPMQTTAIRSEQSLSLVEIFLHGAIASVLYSRELIRHGSPAYAERRVADLFDASGPVTYRNLLERKIPSEHNNSQVFKVLVQGRSEKADRILTLLEGGIFHALHRGYLEAVQLSICADSSRPSEIMECYTFTFTYHSAPGQSHRGVSSVTVSPGPQPAFFVEDAQLSFNAAIKGLLKVILRLPPLPCRRNLGLNLFYTDDCPATYEPQGFESCNDDVIHFPGGIELAKKSEKTAGLVVGTYRTGVVVSHVSPAAGLDPDYLKVIPEVMDYSTKCSRLDEYKINLTPPPLPKPSQHSAPGGILASSAAPSTQTRHDIRTKQALQQMQRSSSRPQDLVPTQSLLRSDDTDEEDSDGSEQLPDKSMQKHTRQEDFKQSMLVPTKMAELIVHALAVQQRCPVDDPLFDQVLLEKDQIRRLESTDEVKCECANKTATNAMLDCELCGTLQHASCYGWEDMAKDRRPIEHFCYSCLLLPKEKALNDWMPTLVKCRKVLKYLEAQKLGVPVDDSGLVEALQFRGDPKDLMTSPIMQTLLKNKLIKKNHADRILENNYEVAWAEYVNPLANIYHLYQTYTAVAGARPRFMYSEALRALRTKYARFALDVIRTHDSHGDEVIRYGYYPREAAVQSRKRSASMVQDSQPGSSVAGAAGVGHGGDSGGGAGEGGPSKMPRRSGARKMSRSEMICCDANATDKETFEETEDEMEVDTEMETETETEREVVVVSSDTETETEAQAQTDDDDDLYN
ncbi:hypothetical protein GJ744_003176 [Endocarpon pusillum]|uniref:HORMA domain-containing protein n=1 Tax=Endocarpon pusillum TaxID=364733 RepID=A0A8H7AMM3_9EURO|nr:hypothetical protein GJ744_003176 [Endocarpon pusillum]